MSKYGDNTTPVNELPKQERTRQALDTISADLGGKFDEEANYAERVRQGETRREAEEVGTESLKAGDRIKVIGGKYKGESGVVAPDGCTAQQVYVTLEKSGNHRVNKRNVEKVDNTPSAL